MCRVIILKSRVNLIVQIPERLHWIIFMKLAQNFWHQLFSLCIWQIQTQNNVKMNRESNDGQIWSEFKIESNGIYLIN